MRKVNFIIIAIFTLMFAGNAFGQWTPDDDKILRIKASKIKAKNKSKTVHDRYANQEVSYRRKTKQKTAQYNPKEIGIDKIKAKKPTSFTSAEGRSMSFELRRKPRKGKRVHKP